MSLNVIASLEAVSAHVVPAAEAGLEPHAFQRQLMQMVLDGQGLETMTRALAASLGRTVLVEDRQFNVMAIAPSGDRSEAFISEVLENKGTPVSIMKQWEEDGTLKTLRRDKQEVLTADRRIVPVVVGESVVAFLSILNAETLNPTEAFRVESGKMAIAMEMVKQSGAVETEKQAKQAFFRDLLLAETPSQVEALRRRATYAGYSLKANYWVLHIEFDNVQTEVAPEKIHRLEGVLSALLSFRDAVVVKQARGVTILYPVKEGQPSNDKIRQLATAIQAKGSDPSVGGSLSVGVGRLHPDLLSVPRAYKEAQDALKIGRGQGQGAVTLFSELGVYRMLLEFATSQDPSVFYWEPLQKLIDYNNQTDKELVRTLEAFLECNGNLTETSEKLFIHRNTLKYRLERIAEVSGLDLSDSETRLMAQLGLRMNRVLRILA
jgi:purine catabolism regulator